MTFWQAYWKLTVLTLKMASYVVGMLAYGYLVGRLVTVGWLWLSVLMLLAAVAVLLAFGARQMTRCDR